jgi:hypothetical protein
MKGTDLSPEQMAHAESFLRECATPVPLIGAKTMLDVEHLIRLLAWYGAIRAKSGRLSPAPLVHRDARLTPSDSISHVLSEVANRRSMQDTQWGGPAHDDTHQPADWVNYIRKFMMRACETNSYSGFEDAMLDVSALAVAAIQSTRRRHDKVGRKCNSCHGTGKLHLAVGQPSDKEACLDCKGHGYYEGSYNGT